MDEAFDAEIQRLERRLAAILKRVAQLERERTTAARRKAVGGTARTPQSAAVQTRQLALGMTDNVRFSPPRPTAAWQRQTGKLARSLEPGPLVAIGTSGQGDSGGTAH